ncbi:MAG: hypothetical protein ICV66_06770 [Chitinophagaceae bacterium]|nr:hypothetical protein [Chitinophagaceae bacterium]
MGIVKRVARRCNISYVQASAAARGRRNLIGISSYLQLCINYRLQFQAGRSLNTPPSAIPKPLAVIVTDGPSKTDR